MKIKIIHEDPDFIVVDKPWGITVNKSETAKEKTVQDWAEKKLGISSAEVDYKNTSYQQPRVADDARQSFPKSSNVPRLLSERRSQSLNDSKTVPKSAFSSSASGLRSASSIEEEFLSRGGVVHRLDKETSGLLLIAKNPQSFSNLQKQFKQREVKKVYLALVHGEVRPEKGEISASVGRLPYNRIRFGVIAGGREATTDYEVINYYRLGKEKFTYLRLNPKTGRTHQIRVHLKYINHPIFSDPLYGGRKVSRADRKLLPRLFLHASEISFLHPKNNQIISLESPLPQELVNFLLTLSEVSI